MFSFTLSIKYVFPKIHELLPYSVPKYSHEDVIAWIMQYKRLEV